MQFFRRKPAQPAPKRFRVWFKSGAVDQAAIIAAVQAWTRDQHERGIEIDSSSAASTEFEVQPGHLSCFLD